MSYFGQKLAGGWRYPKVRHAQNWTESELCIVQLCIEILHKINQKFT